MSATIDGISEPGSVVVADRAYVSAASNDQDAVVAVDTGTGVPLAAKKFDMSAGGLAVSPTGDVLYVARTGDDQVDVAAIDTESGDIATIDIPAAPGATVVALRISADGARLFAALAGQSGASLAIVDTKTHAVERTVAIAGSVGDIAVAPHGRTVFATGWDAEFGGAIHVIDVAGARVTDTIGMGGMPTQVALSRRGDCAYVVDRNEIAVLCTATSEIVDSIVLGPELSCLAADPVRDRLFVADYTGGITALRIETTAKRPQLAAAAS